MKFIPGDGNVFLNRTNVISASGVQSFAQCLGLTGKPHRPRIYDDPCTQVSIDYVQDAHRHN
jgi:hypothetical protein